MTSPKAYGRIYLITNTVNGKYYVGQTIRTLQRRWYAHTTGTKTGCKYVRSAIDKHGPENFIIEELVTADSREDLNLLEKLWILALRSFDRVIGYNLTFGGREEAPTEETRKRMSESAKKRFTDPVERNRISEATKKGQGYPEVRRQMSASAKKRTDDPSERLKRSERMLRKYEDPAVRQKTSESTKKAMSSPEIRQKLSDSAKARHTREKGIKLLERQIAHMDWEKDGKRI
jgi:group I intron endonuclease